MASLVRACLLQPMCIGKRVQVFYHSDWTCFVLSIQITLIFPAMNASTISNDGVLVAVRNPFPIERGQNRLRLPLFNKSRLEYFPTHTPPFLLLLLLFSLLLLFFQCYSQSQIRFNSHFQFLESIQQAANRHPETCRQTTEFNTSPPF